MLDRWRSGAYLMGIASAAAAIASLPVPTEEDPALRRPVVYAISVLPDTVWFCAVTYPALTPTHFVFARETRRWTRAVGTPPCHSDAAREREYGDTIPLAPGLSAVSMQPTDSTGERTGRAFIRIRDSVANRTVDIRPPFDMSLLRRIAQESDLGTDTVSPGVRSIAVNDSLALIGLHSNIALGAGGIGGIYAYDRRAGTGRFFTSDLLATNSAAGMGVTGNWLWAGTSNYGEEGDIYGDAGLLRMDVRTRAWKSYTDSTSPLPDVVIRSLETDGRVVALATEKGLVVIEMLAGATSRDSTSDDAIARWNVGWFVPSFAGDSLVFEPGPKAAAPLDQEQEAIFTFLQRYASRGHERPVHEVIRQLPRDSIVKAAYDMPAPAGRAISSERLAALFVSLLSGTAEGQQLAASAIGAMRTRAPEAAKTALRRAFTSVDTLPTGADELIANRGGLGAALFAVGDSTPTVWARAALDQVVRTPAIAGEKAMTIVAAAEILASARDPLGLTLLISATPVAPRSVQIALADAFASYDTPQAWGAAVALMRGGLLPKARLLERLTGTAVADRVVGVRVRELIAADISGVDGGAYLNAAMLIRRLRLIEFAPLIIQSFERDLLDSSVLESGHVALVSLSGRLDAPVSAHGLPQGVVGYWKEWLALKPVAVPADVGEVAVREWSRRKRPRETGALEDAP